MKKQTGSAIILAIFIIIIISLLGASLVSLQRDNATGTNYEVYAVRTYMAAYSASEIALLELFPLGDSVSQTSCADVTSNPTLPGGDAGFHGCEVDVTCSLPASGGVATRYQIVSTAVCKTSLINTRRQITVEAMDL